MINLELKSKRLELGYSIDDVESALKIKRDYILAIENGNAEEILPKAYIEGYVRLYARYLNLTNQDIALS
jgi:cytoskeleton protein RodZ